MTSMQSEFVTINFKLAGPGCLDSLPPGEGWRGAVEMYNWSTVGNAGPQRRVVRMAHTIFSLVLHPYSCCFQFLQWRTAEGEEEMEEKDRGMVGGGGLTMVFEHHRGTLTSPHPSQKIFTVIYTLYIHKYRYVYTHVSLLGKYIFIYTHMHTNTYIYVYTHIPFS